MKRGDLGRWGLHNLVMAKSFVAQLAPPSVFNEDIQGFKSPLPYCNYRII